MNKLALAVLAAALLALPPSANAWTRAGHMVSAAIALEDLAAREPAVIDKVTDIIVRHPDRAAFSVAVDVATGRERAMRLFTECARWPDDSRDTVYDHPTWHYASRPVIRRGTPKPPPPKETSGQAIEALELNLRMAANPNAPARDRAVALCWVMHLVADMHQPLHTASLYSAAFPDGDAGGNKQFVRDPSAPEPTNLHFFWDDCVLHSGELGLVTARAKEIAALHPRTNLPELRKRSARAWTAWAFEESYALALQAFPPDFTGGTSAQTAVPLPPGYAQNARAAAERRMAVAGYRMSDLLREITAASR